MATHRPTTAARRGVPRDPPSQPQADIVSHPEDLMHQARQALSESSPGITIRDFLNQLVDWDILSDGQIAQHLTELDRLFHDWQEDWQAQQQVEHNQPLPISPRTLRSLPLQAAPPKAITESASNGVRPDRGMEKLQAAVAAVDSSRRTPDAPSTTLYLPGYEDRSAPVTRMESLCPQSYIRAETLKRNDIKWEGSTVDLRWKRLAMPRTEDQSVQRTCFNVVDEKVASQAGLRFDMLIGSDHRLPIHEQRQALAAEESSSANSSVTVGMHGLVPRSSEVVEDCLDDTARSPPLRLSHGSHPQTIMLIVKGLESYHDCANVCNSLLYGGHAGSTVAGRLNGRSVQSHGPNSWKRRLSYSDTPAKRLKRSREDQGQHDNRAWHGHEEERER